MEASSPIRLRLRLIYSIIGVLVGLSAAVVFSIHFKNYNAGLWGLCSGLAAFTALCVTIAYIRRAWDSNPLRLKYFMLSGCFIQLAGVCGFVAYLVLAISQNQKVSAYHDGFYVVCVWCFMTWKWGFLLLIYSRSYLRVYQIRQDILKIIADKEDESARTYQESQSHTQYNTFNGNSA